MTTTTQFAPYRIGGFRESINQLRNDLEQDVRNGRLASLDVTKIIKCFEDAASGTVPSYQFRQFTDMVNRLAAGQTVGERDITEMAWYDSVLNAGKTAAKWAWDNRDEIIKVANTAAKFFEEQGAQVQSYGWEDRGWAASDFPSIINRLRSDLDQGVRAGKIASTDATKIIKCFEDAASGTVPSYQFRQFTDMVNRLAAGQTVGERDITEMAWYDGVVNAAKSVGKFVWDNRETIATVAKVAGTVAMLLEEKEKQKPGQASTVRTFSEGLYYIRKAS